MQKIIAALQKVPPGVRTYLYPVALAVIALLTGYGVLSGDEAALWGALAAAVLSLPVASVNVPKKTE